MAAWVTAAVVSAAAVAMLAFDAGAGPYGSGWAEDVAYGAALLSSLCVGLVLAIRRPSNAIGWILLALASVMVIGGLVESYAAYALNRSGPQPGARFAAVWNTAGWPLYFAPIVALALVFPDGRLPSRRWRLVAAGGGFCVLVVLVSGMLWDRRLDAPFGSVEPYDVLSASAFEPVHIAALLGMIVIFVLALFALARRFRASKGDERLQLKWVAYAGALLPVSIVAGTVDGAVSGGGPGPLTELPFVLMLLALPVSIGIAVMRYRLYEIDRLISATVVYAVLTALLASAFALVSIGVGVALGGGSAVPTAVATLAVVLAFRPLRDRLQRPVDRRFNRARYEGLTRVDAYLAELRAGRAEPEATGGVLTAATADPSLQLFFWLPSDDSHADARGRLVPDLPEEPAGRTPVARGELHLGTVVHDPALRDRGNLLDEVIMRAGLAIEIARLRVEVRRQLAVVEQSRARIVSATLEERRRLERDLHDGAQQQLVSLGLELRHLQQGLDASADDTRAGLDAVVEGLAAAIAQLRELAHGVRPASLEAGLGPALRELTARAPIATHLEVTDERFEEGIETAAYFVATEALANAAKHANPTSVTVRAVRAGGGLTLSVADDGCGGAAPAAGSGLTGMADRVAALGGRIDLRSDRGTGTSIVAEFPCD